MLWAEGPETDIWSSGVIKGTVKNTQGSVLPGTTVIIQELNSGTSTDSQGQFVLENLRQGSYTLLFKHLGFSGQSMQVRVGSDVLHLEVRMHHSHIELKEIVVRESASGVVLREHSLNITMAGKDFLTEAQGTSLMQALQRIPGINSMDIGSGASKPVIRGLGFNRITVAENNIKQQGQQWGADHGLEIDFYGVERVEIIKGPAALLFGSEAIGGALNIRPPAIPMENTLWNEVQLTARSNNDLLGFSGQTALTRDGRFLRVRLSLQDYADYRVPADEFVYNSWRIGLPGRRLKNTSGQDAAFSLSTGVRKNWGITSFSISHFHQKTGFFPATHGIPNPSALQVPGDPRKTDYPRQQVNHFKMISNTHVLLGSNRLEMDWGFQQNHRQELNPPHVHGVGPVPEGFVELDLKLRTLSNNLRWHRQWNDQNAWVGGLASSWQQNQRAGYNFLLPDFRMLEIGLFFIYRWSPFPSLMLNSGVRRDWAMLRVDAYQEAIWADEQTIDSYRERTPALKKDFQNLAFSSGLSWQPSDMLNIKVNIGRSFRNPSAIELSANGMHHGSFRHEMGDSSLEPERAWQLDLGLSFTQKEIYLHFSPFLNYFNNYLFLNPTGLFSDLPGAGQLYRFQQARALHLGGEVYGDIHITEALHASAGLEYVYAQNLNNAYPLPFTSAPAMVNELSYSWRKPFGWMERLKLNLHIRNVAAQNRVARNEPATAAYTLINAGLYAGLFPGSWPIEVSLQLNNVLDKRYQNHLSFYRILELPEPGRNISISLKVALSKMN